MSQGDALLGGSCPDCEGDGEVYVGSSVPDDEGYAPCSACGGTGKLPTLTELRNIRERLEAVEEDLYITELELDQYRKHLKLA